MFSRLSWALVVLLGWQYLNVNAHGQCGHDDQVEQRVVAEQPYTHADKGLARRLSTFAGLRIHLEFDSELDQDPNMTPELAAFMRDMLLPHAREWFEGALQVDPVVSNLVLDGRFPCGSGEMAYSIPDYMTSTGVANTDFVLFVTARQTTACTQSNGGLLASAVTCQRDQFHR